MKPVVHFILPLVIWLGSVADIYATYCCGNSSQECCPFEAIDKPTCRGIGTTSVAALVNILMPPGESYAIIGEYESFYYIFSTSYKFLQGNEGLIYMNTLYGYVIQIPNRCGGHIYYLIGVTGCPYIKIITSSSEGYLDQTSFPLRKIVTTIETGNTTNYCGPCNTITGDFLPVRNTRFYPLDINTPLYVSNLISLKYNCTDKCRNDEPAKAVKKNKLQIERGDCPGLYIEYGLKKGSEPCYKPSQNVPLGRALAREMDFSNYNSPYFLCLLTTKIAKFYAELYNIPTFLFYQNVYLVRPPYTCVITLSGYIPTLDPALFGRALVGIC